MVINIGTLTRWNEVAGLVDDLVEVVVLVAEASETREVADWDGVGASASDGIHEGDVLGTNAQDHHKIGATSQSVGRLHWIRILRTRVGVTRKR